MMPAAAALPPDGALWRPWADLPLDLLRDISRRLHTTIDYIRFHATCKPWRNTLPPASRYPAFLPWLLAPPDATKHRKARCVFSSTKHGAATEIRFRDRRWVISLVDGTAVYNLTRRIYSGSGGPTGCGLTLDPLTGSASATPLPSFSCEETMWWADQARGVVSGDGTILLYFIGPVYRELNLLPFNAALLRPGDAAWTMVHQQYFGLGMDNWSCIAHDGRIVIRRTCSLFCIETRQDQRRWDINLPGEYGKISLGSYLLESRGELLLANVLCNNVLANDYCSPDYRHTVASFLDRLSVSVHVLEEAEGGNMQWVKRDCRSLADRVMFLGRPSSFAVDAVRFGMISGGCAYFVVKNKLYRGIWNTTAFIRCRVFKYSFQDDRSELIEELPAQWGDDACMWLTPPQPSLSSTEEIRERIQPLHIMVDRGPQFGPCFRS